MQTALRTLIAAKSADLYFVYACVLSLARRAQLVTLDDFAGLCQARRGHVVVDARDDARLGTEIAHRGGKR